MQNDKTEAAQGRIHQGSQRQLQLLRRHKESNSMLAIVMSGVAGLLILAAAAAYHYATGTDVAQNPAPRPTASAPASNGSAAQAPASRAETTGSGTAERGPAAEPGQGNNRTR